MSVQKGSVHSGNEEPLVIGRQDESWRDPELLDALRKGRPIGPNGRARIIEWYETLVATGFGPLPDAEHVPVNEAFCSCGGRWFELTGCAARIRPQLTEIP